MTSCPRCGQNHYDTSRPTVPTCPFVPTLPSRPAPVARLLLALQSIANNTCCGPCQEAALVARAALRNWQVAELAETRQVRSERLGASEPQENQ